MTKVVAIDSKPQTDSITNLQADTEAGIPLQSASLDIWDKKYRLKSREAVSYTHLTLPTICSV